MNNEEYINSLKGKELLKFLFDFSACDHCKYNEMRNGCPSDESDCHEEILKWLKQERED